MQANTLVQAPQQAAPGVSQCMGAVLIQPSVVQQAQGPGRMQARHQGTVLVQPLQQAQMQAMACIPAAMPASPPRSLDSEKTVVCHHWKSKGWCRMEDQCKFLHPESKKGVGSDKGRKKAGYNTKGRPGHANPSTERRSAARTGRLSSRERDEGQLRIAADIGKQLIIAAFSPRA